MAKEIIEIVTLPHGEGIELPSYKTDGAAGMDIRAAIDEDLTIAPGHVWRCPQVLHFAFLMDLRCKFAHAQGLLMITA